MPLMLLAVLAACGGSEPVGRTDGTASGPEAQHAADDLLQNPHERGRDVVGLTADQIKTAGIVIEAAASADIHESLPLYGVIAPNAERVRDVAARFPGVIRGVTKRVGDTVRQGETVATVESNESLETYAVAAPLTGVVTARNANPGEQTGDRVLFTVADLATVWVEVSLFPRDVARVRVGQSVQVRNAETGQVAEGRVVYVAPFGSSNTQTLIARVQLDNSDRRWPPGLYVTAAVTLATNTVAVAVRSEALQTLEDRPVVFVRTQAGFEPRRVRIGRSDGARTEILDGIAAGESYAAANSFILKAELGKGEAGHED
jgi:cobalt-zinc-cadmium efflux system membrane fusion protein